MRIWSTVKEPNGRNRTAGEDRRWRQSPGRGGPLVCTMCISLALSAGGWVAARAATVAGTVEVDRASLRSEGPKHDLDVVVSLAPVPPVDSPPVDDAAEMDQRGLVFIPHVLAVQKGTTVTFLNSDNDQHNVYFLHDETGETLDIGTWGPGVSVDHRFEKAGMVITLCKLHLEMAAYLVVLEHPWFTSIELDPDSRNASFEIRDVPPGEYEVTVWHKKLRQKGGPAHLSVGEGAPATVDVVIAPAKYAR